MASYSKGGTYPIAMNGEKQQLVTDELVEFENIPVHTRTIHCAQGLLLDYLAFDPTGVYKHGLIYTALSRIKKKNLYLLQPLQMKNFQVDPNVSIEMNRL